MVDFKIITKGETSGKAVLIERNIKIAEISSEEFAETLYNDIMEAEKFYQGMNNPVLEANYIKRTKEKRQRDLEKAIIYANNTWKTEKRRNQYIEEYKAKIDKPIEIPSGVRDSLKYFDYTISPWSMGADACFRIESLTKEEISQVHNKSEWSEWFKNAIGYRLTYDTRIGGDTYTCTTRPQIELIFNEEWTAKWEAGTKGLDTAVTNFYANTTYFGD